MESYTTDAIEMKDYFLNVIPSWKIRFRHFAPLLLRIDGILQLWLIIIN